MFSFPNFENFFKKILIDHDIDIKSLVYNENAESDQMVTLGGALSIQKIWHSNCFTGSFDRTNKAITTIGE